MSITLDKNTRFSKKHNPVLKKDFTENNNPELKTVESFFTNKSFFPALIQYKGGGYDGCFWEPNFCFIDIYDGETTFWNVGSSGYYKIEDEKQLYKRLVEFTLEEPKNIFNSDNFYFFKIPKEDCKNYEAKLDSLAKDIETNVNQMYTNTIFNFLQLELGLDIKQSCGVCKERFKENELIFAVDLGYGRSGGGLTITTDYLPVCHDCVSSHSCCKCGSFYGYSEDENEKDGKWMSEGDGCISCEPVEEKESLDKHD